MKAATPTTASARRRRRPAPPLPPPARLALPSTPLSLDELHDEHHHDDDNLSGLMSSSPGLPPSLAMPLSPRQQHAAPFEDQKFCGFTFNFSNTVPGMLYRSRNDPRNLTCAFREATTRAPDPSPQATSKPPRDQATTARGSLTHKASDDALADDDEAGFTAGDVVGMMAPEKLDLRQRMTLTLRNWCLDEGNMTLIAREGAIQALAALASREDRLTRRFCAAAFYSLSHNPAFRGELVQVGACAIIAQVALNTKSPRVALSCASSLCNLSLEPGAEARLAEEGAVGALCTLLLTFPERDVWVTSLQGLYNLTCVTESYQGLDRVLKGLLSAYDTPCQELDPSQIVGLAIANLSVIHRMRLRILEEGLVDVMSRYILPFADGALRYNVAVALHNVACARACSGEMINRGVMSCLVTLTRPPTKSSSRASVMVGRGAAARDDGEQRIQSQQPQQQHIPLLDCLATTLQYLSLEVEARRKTIQDGAVRAILNILEQTTEPCVLQACAEALHAFTSFGDCAVLLIKHQAVPALIKLSETLLASNDPQRRRQRHSVVASFCNLLSAENHHGPVLDYKSCLTCVLRLAECLDEGGDSKDGEDEMLLEYLSCVFSNLACGAPRRFQAVMAGLVPRLVQLCDLEVPAAVSIKLKSRCATALANLMAIATTGGNGSSSTRSSSSSSDGGSGTTITKQQNNNNLLLERMVQDGVVGCLARLLVASTDVMLLESVTTALALTSFHHDDVKAEMIHQGIVHSLIRAVTDEVLRGDKTHAAATIFASLSYSARHIPHLFEAGVLDAIFLLAKTEETATRKRCATVLCNLSYDPHVRNHMVERKVVLLLAQLSNTYSDETQMDCAWCFCNLACGGGAGAEEVARTTLNRDTMVKQGAVGALLMIALVRAVTTQTREVCAQALFNLITEGTTARVIDDGITQGLASLCGLDSEVCLQICAQAFWTLSLHPIGRAKISSKRNIMQGLCSLIRSDVVTTRTLCGATVLNLLLLEAETAVLATEAGALGVVKVMCTSGDAAVQVECAHAIAKIAPLPACRAHMPKESIPQAMVLLAQQNQDEATAVAALRALTCLALSHFPLAVLLQAGILHVVIYRVLSSVFLGADAGSDGIIGDDDDDKEKNTTSSSSSSSSGNSGKDVIESCVHILYRFALSKELRLAMTKTQVVCAVVVLLRRVGAWKEEKPQQPPRALLLETMLATTLERLSWVPASQHHIVGDGGMLALVELIKRRHDAPPPYGARLAKSLAIVFANLARAEGRRLHLVSVGVIEALTIVLKKGFLLEDGIADKKDVVAWRAVLGLLHLSESSDDLLVAVALNGALEFLVFIILSASGKVGERSEVLQRYAAGALCNFSRCQECRPLLAAQAGGVEAIMTLSKSDNAAIQGHCSIMLANLSGQQHAKLRLGSVGTLVNLFKSQDRHEKARPSLDGTKDNKKGAIQAKFRRLLMAATLAKELNDGTKATAAGGAASTPSPGAESSSNSTGGDVAEGVDAERKVQDAEESDEDDDGADDDGVDDEEKSWHAYHVRATQTSSCLPTTRLVDLVSLVTQQQQARLASWDMAPSAHETVFYKCSHVGVTSGAVAAISSSNASTNPPVTRLDSSSLSSQEGDSPTSPASSATSSSLPPPPSSAAFSFQVRNIIAVSHPKLSECPVLRPRQSEKLKGAATTTVAYLMERRKSTFHGVSDGLAPGVTLAPAKDEATDKPTDEEKQGMEGAAVTKAVKWFSQAASRSAPRPSYPPSPKHAVTKPELLSSPVLHPASPSASSSAETVDLVLVMGRMEQSLLSHGRDSPLAPLLPSLLSSPAFAEPQAAVTAPAAAAPSSPSRSPSVPSVSRRSPQKGSPKVNLALLEEAFSYGARGGGQEQKKGGGKKKSGGR